MKRRWWIWSVAGFVLAAIIGGGIWYWVIWNEPAGIPVPSQHAATAAVHQTAQGLKTKNKALFLRVAGTNKTSAETAWETCSVAFNSSYTVSSVAHVGVDDIAVYVDRPGGKQICGIELSWAPKTGWSMSSFAGNG